MLIQAVFSDPILSLYSLSIGLLVVAVFQVIRFYLSLSTLPPGPLPLPVIGNILVFLKKGQRLPHEVITEFKNQYGPVFTFWTGPDPQVILANAKVAKEALNKTEFAGRPEMAPLKEAFFEKNSADIAFTDFSREWEVLRKVSHSAVRKFAVSERLPVIVDSKVKTFLKEIKDQNGDKPFDPTEYVNYLMVSLLASSAYGKDFAMKDPDFQELHAAGKLQDENVNKILLITFFPALKHVFREARKAQLQSAKTQRNYAISQYKKHVASYKEGVIRDFTDALIFAKKEAEAEDSNDAKYLKDANIVNSVINLFLAGSETTKMTLLWILLFLAEFPQYQKAIREEVEAAVGSDEMVTLEHRPQCNLLQAFVYETMRFRPILPFSLPHKAIADTLLGGNKIRKDVTVIISLEQCLMDKEVWGDPEVFRPERFLNENNKLSTKRDPFFVPFGGGRRVCLGEKLAGANSFLIVAGLLHQTKGQMMSFPGGPGSVDLKPAVRQDANVRPVDYQLVFTSS